MMLCRETIVALRARHTAFRMALAILHAPPPAAAPEPPAEERPSTVDALPAVDVLAQFSAWEREQRQQRDARRRRTSRRLMALLWAAAIALGAWNWDRKAPPSAQPPPAMPRSLNR
jgi:hypothetical protein